ncbi:ATP-binding protein [Vibrio sp. ZSDZ34]|uniref:ATP-binding protein n=1 Tax=Vibrio gelatinilyticus TaxID=2893468 RepID=A0A9X1WAM2_9VIBR|nr:AAA family ATPase [Vibrio gelatinilyticus]MCJ2376566.1 ATP-binding protein [Vibrio gelatinilyticus]
MRYFLCFLVVLFGIYPSFAVADWQYEEDSGPKVGDTAIKISDAIESLPSRLFFTETDSRKVEQLLNATLAAQNREIDNYGLALERYRKEMTDEQWHLVRIEYLTLTSLSQSKQRLLELAPSRFRDELTGFGPRGVQQFTQEWRISRLNVEYFIYLQVRSLKALITDLFISPIPVIWAGLKVFAIYLALMWWLANHSRLYDQYRELVKNRTTAPPLWMKVIWYIGRAGRAIAWLIALTLSLRILAELDALSQLIFLEIITWWVLGGAIAISFILEFIHRNSRSVTKQIVQLRLSTVRRYVWSFMVAGLVLQISAQTLGKGTIYFWISSFVTFWFALITLSILLLWKSTVFASLSRITDKPVYVTWAEGNKDSWLLGIVASAIAMLWLVIHHTQHRLIGFLSAIPAFNQALTYLFKIEVAKQSSSQDEQKNLVRIKGNEAFDYILPGNDFSPIVDYAKDELNQLCHYLLTDSPAICVVSGERGVGTTRLLKQILHKAKNAEPVYLNCPYSGYNALLVHLAVSIGLEEDTSDIKILNHLRKSETTYLIALDNCQRLVKPKVGGLADLIKLTNLLRRSKKNHRAILSIEKSSWRFVDRSRGERLLFDWVTFMPRWNEQQIRQLFDSRINQNVKYPVSFDGLVVPKQWDNDSETEEERAKQGFYRILWHYSDGNPTVALRFFRLSIRKHKENGKVVVRLFNAPVSEELEKMPKPMLAVLRSIVQLEIASPEDLSECTQLSIAEVIGVLRYFQSRGFIEWAEEKARISDHWFRHITNVLDRQHLLVK